MNGLMKALTGILGLLAILACIATVAIIGYSFVNNDSDNNKTAKELAPKDIEIISDETQKVSVPTAFPDLTLTVGEKPANLKVPEGHVHDYKEEIIKKATCLESGQIKFTCSCGDYYVVDQMSTGHVPDDWEIVREATETEDGSKVRKCIYCDEIVASEKIPSLNSLNNNSGNNKEKHEHLYVATTEREPSCVLAGLRKLTCECGSFYTETIPAVGHVATDWETAEEPTTSSYGTSQRVCVVCGALLDTKTLDPLKPSPSPSASGAPGSSSSPASSPSASASGASTPSPSPTPHVHKYTNYVLTAATCTEKGVRSYICSCGSSYAESIELDLNNHSYRATFVAPTETQQGYTVYTCTRCNYNYMDNYIMPLSNKASSESQSLSGTNGTN